MNELIELYHGGSNWEGAAEIQPPRAKRYEHGPGIYFTTRYETAKKYAKGRGVVKRFWIKAPLRSIDSVKISAEEALLFIAGLERMKNRQKVLDDIRRYADRVKQTQIPLSVVNNLCVNHEAVPGAPGVKLAMWFASHGAEAEINRMGSESWLVLFNPLLITRADVVASKSVKDWDLPLLSVRDGMIVQER